ncbi:MAG TPA: glucosaminidase domain-containing protein [Chitinophagaceae bacterium]|nr:glucosaminidase domain-containing protein [Chitinophagaceae bacterium]
MRKTVLLLFSCLFFAISSFAQSQHTASYIKKYKHIAIQEMVRTGVPAAISLAQGIIESGAGTSWLSTHANNQFGIKCKSNWRGKTVHKDDDKNNECFRKYAHPEASWKDHSDFLRDRERYHFLFYLDPLDYKAWAYGLKEAGYATNNKYAHSLIKTIKKYHLNQYTKQGIIRLAQSTPQKDNSSIPTESHPEKIPNPHHQKIAKHTSFNEEPVVINRRKAIYLPAGTQLIGIANQYDIPLRRLLRYNELESEILVRNMFVFIEKKRKQGNHTKHIVTAGEKTYHEIAQKEGIRLKWLRKRNYLNNKKAPQAGDVLILKGYVRKKGGNRAISGFARFLKKIFGGNKSAKQTSGQVAIYKVKRGDTLYQLAQKNDTSVQSIRQLNHLNSNTIRVGQRLKIPQRR